MIKLAISDPALIILEPIHLIGLHLWLEITGKHTRVYKVSEPTMQILAKSKHHEEGKLSAAFRDMTV